MLMQVPILLKRLENTSFRPASEVITSEEPVPEPEEEESTLPPPVVTEEDLPALEACTLSI